MHLLSSVLLLLRIRQIATAVKQYNTIGKDLVAMCVNDILCHGAKPLFFLDYLACGTLDKDQLKEVVKGIACACKEAGAALVGELLEAIRKLIMSHSLLWSHIVLLTVGVYSSNHRVLSTIGISMTRRFLYTIGISMRRFQKSVGSSVCPSVTLLKKAYSSFIIDSRKIIRISGERVWHPLQENEVIFSKKYFSKILD